MLLLSRRWSLSKTFYWHDYETWGINPRRDRAVQFAGIRTDEELNIISDPLTLYCKPADDFLPHPQACLVTGITPQTALEQTTRQLELAGNPRNMSAAHFWMLRIKGITTFIRCALCSGCFPCPHR